VLLVLLDTSVLIYLVEKPSSFLEELDAKVGRVELCVPAAVVRELEGLTQGRGEKAKKAKEALAFAEGLRVVECPGEADDAIVSIAQQEGAIVGTLDKELLDSLRRKEVAVATLRGDRLLLLGKSI
jgi:rRNA-processing protein FCF1